MKRKIDHSHDRSSDSSENGADDDPASSSSDSRNSGEPAASEASTEIAAVGIVTSPTFSSLFSVTPSLSSSSRASVVSLREERKACRRHRRRLARIVTEQWKYAARSRILALKFSRVMGAQYVKIGFLEWKDMAREKSAILKQVEYRFPVALSQRSLRVWIKFTRREQKLRVGLARFSQSSSAFKSISVLKAWRDYAQMRLAYTKQMFTAEHYYMISLLSKCFSDWRIARQVHQKKDFYNNVASAKWIFSRQRLVLRVWRLFLARKTDIKALVKAWERRTLSKCIHYWHSRRNVVSDSEGEDSIRSLLAKAEHDTIEIVARYYFGKKTQRDILSEWLRTASSTAAAKRTVDIFYQHNILSNALKRSFHHWKQYRFRKRFQRDQNSTALKFWRSHRLTRCIRWWLQYNFSKISRYRCKELALKHWKAGTLRKCMLSWVDFYFIRRSRHEKEGYAAEYWRDYRLRGCFHNWSRFAFESRCQRRMEQKVASYRKSIVGTRCLTAWRDRSRCKNLLADQFRELKAILDSLKRANAWCRWVEYSRKKSKKKLNMAKAEYHCKMQRTKIASRAWQQAILLEQGQDMDQTVQAFSAATQCVPRQQPEAFYTKLLQRLALLGWFQIQKSKPPSRESQHPQQEQQEHPHSAKHVVRVRPAPRRPSFAFNDVRHALPLPSPAFDASSLSGQSLGPREFPQAYFCKHDENDYHPAAKRLTSMANNKDNDILRATNHSRAAVCEDYIYCIDSEAEFSHVIADEVAWMEHILANFDDLRAELVEKRAELAILLEKNSPGSRDKVQLLSQKIALLQQRRAILLPTIQAVASTIPGLRLRARKATSSLESRKS